MYYDRNRLEGISIRHDRQEIREYTSFSMHTHATAELYYFIQGRAVFHIEGNSYTLQPGDILLMRPSEAHYVEQDPEVPYERICLHFDTTLFAALDPDNSLMRPYYDREPGKGNLFRLEGEEIRTFLNHILKASDRLKAIANLILLLQKVGEAFQKGNMDGSQPDTLEYRIVHYINQNLSSELSIQELCSRFFISRAQLCRRFKKITGTSVGKYVSAKRLIAAQNLLLQGKRPTEVYATCGYQDYSTFYRAYLQYFGCSPKELPKSDAPEGERLEIM